MRIYKFLSKIAVKLLNCMIKAKQKYVDLNYQTFQAMSGYGMAD